MKNSGLYIVFFLFGLISLSCSKDDEVADNPLTINYEFTDLRDGKIYEMVEIDGKFWMTRNLDYTPFVGVSSYYNNDSTLGPDHGKLYDFAAAMNAVPDGWHLPSKQEWHNLIEHMGGQQLAGGMMKSVAGNFWNEPNVGATNDYGFLGYGSGVIDGLGSNGFKNKSNFWSSTEYDLQPDKAHAIGISNESSAVVFFEDYKYVRFSVRCVKD